MAWIAGDLVIDPAAGQSLVSTRFTTPSPHTYVTVVVSSQIALQTMLQLLDGDNAVVRQIPFHVNGEMKATPRLGPFTADRNYTLRVINRNAVSEVSGEEVHASMFVEP